MDLGDLLSPVASLIVGFVGALFGVRQANAAWLREQRQKRTLALRNYERSLYDMALHLEGVEYGQQFNAHPKPDDLEETRREAFPYFQEFERDEYFKLLAPHPSSGGYSAMEDSDRYAEVSQILKNKLDAEKDKPGNRLTLFMDRQMRRLVGLRGLPPGKSSKT